MQTSCQPNKHQSIKHQSIKHQASSIKHQSIKHQASSIKHQMMALNEDSNEQQSFYSRCLGIKILLNNQIIDIFRRRTHCLPCSSKSQVSFVDNSNNNYYIKDLAYFDGLNFYGLSHFPVEAIEVMYRYAFFKMGLPRPLYVLFKHTFYRKNCRLRTLIVGVEGEHADHQITTTAQVLVGIWV